MPKAEPKYTRNPDAALYSKINNLTALWREYSKLPEDHPRYKRVFDEASALECEIAHHIPAKTRKGFDAKVRAINRAVFDDVFLIEIAFHLGRDAATLGITKLRGLEVGETYDRPSNRPPRKRKAVAKPASKATAVPDVGRTVVAV